MTARAQLIARLERALERARTAGTDWRDWEGLRVWLRQAVLETRDAESEAQDEAAEPEAAE